MANGGTINGLPVEIIDLIAHELDDDSLFSLHSVSRRLCQATCGIFAKTWFATLTVDFTPRCFRRLSGISQRQEFASSVRKIVVGRCNKPGVTKYLGEDYIWTKLGSGYLDLESYPAKEFSTVLRRFTNCDEIFITDSLPERYESIDGVHPPHVPAPLKLLDVLRIIGSALNSHVGFPIHRFHLTLETLYHSNSLEAIPQALGGILSNSYWPSHLKQLDINQGVDYAVSCSGIVELLASAKNLESFRLDFKGFRARQLFRKLLDAPQVPALTHLTLGNFKLDLYTQIYEVAQRFRATLRTLHLNRLDFFGQAWRPFLRLLSIQDLPHLESFTIQDCIHVYFCPLRLKQDEMARCGGCFEFTIRHFRNKGRVSGVRYRGSGEGMRLALRAIAEESYYYLRDDNPDRGYPDMGSYTGDAIGHVVEELV
ncbi:hypothetical protein F4778DRAFT_605187 [Xylariomycetidae sp. FL2044]|nr:hypothetical protein F4778DRAFT_605187 [Xylariomycetidae sp. FL2044]